MLPGLATAYSNTPWSGAGLAMRHRVSSIIYIDLRGPQRPKTDQPSTQHTHLPGHGTVYPVYKKRRRLFCADRRRR